MWGRNRKRAAREVDEIRAARVGQARADAVLEHLAQQQPEIDERVGRLVRREGRNNFGEALDKAMQRREATT